MPLSPAKTPVAGHGDVQVDGNASGEVMGPAIVGGNIRYRHGITDQLALTGDLGFARAQNGDNFDGEPWAALGRAGVQRSTELNEDLDGALFAGVGGGYAPAAAGWLSADTGVVVTGDNRHVRPVVVLDAYASQPFATKVFAVDDEMLRMPRTFGVQGVVGFELGPKRSAVLIGMAVSRLWAVATDVQDAQSETFFGLGGGVRFDTLQ